MIIRLLMRRRMSLRETRGRRERRERIARAKRAFGLTGWGALLARRPGRPIRMRDGTELKSLADARAMMLAKVEGAAERRNEWQKAAELLLAAAQTNEAEDIEAATRQVELALLLNGWLVPDAED